MNNQSISKVSSDVTERAEICLRDYYRKREHLQKEIKSLHAEMRQALDKLFEDLNGEIEQQTHETNAVLNPIVEEFKVLASRRKELDIMKRKLMPVFELMGGRMPSM